LTPNFNPCLVSNFNLELFHSGSEARSRPNSPASFSIAALMHCPRPGHRPRHRPGDSNAVALQASAKLIRGAQPKRSRAQVENKTRVTDAPHLARPFTPIAGLTAPDGTSPRGQ
jgi:hypothetical protein